MTPLLLIVGAAVGGAVVIARALLVDETRGRLRRRVTASVEATIESLPPDVRDEWAEEWRADLEEVLAMPLTALAFARNLRLAARELVGDSVPVPSPVARKPLTGIDGFRGRWKARRQSAGLARRPGLVTLPRQWRGMRTGLAATGVSMVVSATITGVSAALSLGALAYYTLVAGVVVCAVGIGLRRARRRGR